MPTQQETSYSPAASGSGPAFRVLQFTTSINGVPTQVAVEGVVLVDADGRIVFKPGDETDQLAAILAELRAIKMQLAGLTGLPVDAGLTGIGG